MVELVELRLPLEVDMEPDEMREHVPIFPGSADLDAVDRSPGTQRWKWPRHRLSLPPTPEPRGQLLGAGALPVGPGMVVVSSECPTRRIGLTQRRLDTGIQQVKPTLDRTHLEFDQARDGLPHMTGPGLRNKLPDVSDDSDLTRGPKYLLMDTVARL